METTQSILTYRARIATDRNARRDVIKVHHSAIELGGWVTIRHFRKSWVGLRLVQILLTLPYPHPNIGDFKTLPSNYNQTVADGTTLLIDKRCEARAFYCLLLLSTCQLNRNSIPRCAHSSCKCTKIFIGFTICLPAKKFVWHIGGISATICGLFLFNHILVLMTSCC